MYLLKKTDTGYKFDVYTDDTRVKIGSSEVYSKSAAAAAGIATAITSAAIANVSDPTQAGSKKVKCPRFEYFQDASGKWRSRLKGTNGRIIASSPAFTNKGELGKYIPGYGPKEKWIYIIVFINGVPVVVRVKLRNPIDPKATPAEIANTKTFIEGQIKGALALASRPGKQQTQSPLVISAAMPDDLSGLVKPIKSVDFDIKKFDVNAVIKEVLNE